MSISCDPIHMPCPTLNGRYVTIRNVGHSVNLVVDEVDTWKLDHNTDGTLQIRTAKGVVVNKCLGCDKDSGQLVLVEDDGAGSVDLTWSRTHSRHGGSFLICGNRKLACDNNVHMYLTREEADGTWETWNLNFATPEWFLSPALAELFLKSAVHGCLMGCDVTLEDPDRLSLPYTTDNFGTWERWMILLAGEDISSLATADSIDGAVVHIATYANPAIYLGVDQSERALVASLRAFPWILKKSTCGYSIVSEKRFGTHRSKIVCDSNWKLSLVSEDFSWDWANWMLEPVGDRGGLSQAVTSNDDKTSKSDDDFEHA